ncbi:MAG: hypothetical protein QM758_01060 [Armatimonas sp.]
MDTRAILIPGAGQPPQPPVLSDSDRNAVRLRVVRTPTVRLILQEPALQKARGEAVTLPSETFWSVAYYQQNPDNNTLLGSVLYRDVPNQLKRSDLNYGASELNASLSPESAKNVGELIALAAKRTGVELYVDPRLALYRVHFLGTSARAGDVLQGLAYALTGTFRRIEGGPWVLTGDLEPVSVRLAQRQKWVDSAISEVGDITSTRISWTLPEAPSVGSLAGKTEGRYSVSQLPPEIRALVDQRRKGFSPEDTTTTANGISITSINTSFSINGVPVTANSFVPDAVQISTPLEGQLLLPNGAAVRDGRLTQIIQSATQGANSSTPVFPKQIALKRAPSLLLRVDTPESARRAVQLAATHHIPELWLALPLATNSASEKALLTAALAEGKTQKVAVGALVHLLTTSPDSQAPDRDERLTGGRQPAQSPSHLQGTSLEWIAPDAPGVTEKLRTRLSTLATLEGLAGLAVVETAPMGYYSKLPARYESAREDLADGQEIGWRFYGRQVPTHLTSMQAYFMAPSFPVVNFRVSLW